MKTLVFDTETTGFRPGQICQLAYVTEDGEGGPVRASNLFFRVDSVEPGAEAVHGFSAESLAGLSGGRCFADRAQEVLDAFAGCDLWVAHNFQFDKGFLIAEFRRTKKFLPFPQRTLCTMRHFTPICKLPPVAGRTSNRPYPGAPMQMYKFPSLSELCAFLGITEDDVLALTNELFPADDSAAAGGEGKAQCCGQGCGADHANGAHDARYDACATFLCYKRAREQGYLSAQNAAAAELLGDA